jgi:hypothetical protein
VGRSLYWRVLAAWQTRDHRFVIGAALAAFGLLGNWGAPGLLLRKLRLLVASYPSPGGIHGEEPSQGGGKRLAFLLRAGQAGRSETGFART